MDTWTQTIGMDMDTSKNKKIAMKRTRDEDMYQEMMIMNNI